MQLELQDLNFFNEDIIGQVYIDADLFNTSWDMFLRAPYGSN